MVVVGPLLNAAAAVLLTPVTAEAGDGSELTTSLLDILLLRDYTTRTVVVGTTLLGIAAGVIGTFTYLRKRALMGDALSHAALPGIAAMFLISGSKELTPLIAGAAIAGTLGIFTLTALRRFTRLKEDAAIGIVLSVFFAIGLALLSVVQQLSSGGQAGLKAFIYGKAAAMVRSDAALIAWVCTVVLIAVAMLYKQFKLLCFDQEFARAQGHAVTWIDLAMMALVIITTVVGLQAVGLIMIIALLIVPAAAARFWTEKLWSMILIAGGFGALSGWSGSTISALAPRMPTGAVIVVCAGVLFTASLLLAPYRGVIGTVWRRWSLSRKIHAQHLLRAMAELEERYGTEHSATRDELQDCRGWRREVLQHTISRAASVGDIEIGRDGRISLSASGRRNAQRVLRNHRLWEIYLIKYADIAPSHVDRDADEVEHVLSEELIRELDSALQVAGRIPVCPHSELPGGTVPAAPGS